MIVVISGKQRLDYQHVDSRFAMPMIQQVWLLFGFAFLTSCSQLTSLPALSQAEAQATQRGEAERLGVPVMLTNDLGMTFALIPAGEFAMGSPRGEAGRQGSETQHNVTLTRPFYLGTTEVTQAQWRALMEKNPSFVEGEGHPVETITWNDAVEFCRRLSERDGACYRLPTEAEWEYACRAGTTTAYHTGGKLSTAQANYNGEADNPDHGLNRDETTPVRSFEPNAWGLYDMHGNVWEWCSDWHGPYDAQPTTDPRGPDEGTTRIVRGGCWVNASAICRSAMRGDTEPMSWNFHFGMRVVREIEGRPLAD
jgi:formylglycine-generating enzyme required for sulfatase activity